MITDRKMISKTGLRGHRWFRILRGMAAVLAVAVVSLLGIETWEYVRWRNKMIEWDFGTIDRLCGGDTENDRLLDVWFVKKWEYKALKKTSDGEHVWLHWKLSKRQCGNWMLIEKPQGYVIPPIELRFPNGVPHRRAVSCLGIPLVASKIPNRSAHVPDAQQ